jgi:hypothetical protein
LAFASTAVSTSRFYSLGRFFGGIGMPTLLPEDHFGQTEEKPVEMTADSGIISSRRGSCGEHELTA